MSYDAPTLNVFAYGTLQFPAIWSHVARCPSSSVNAQLHGFAVYRIKGAVYPGIIPSTRESTVNGVVYLGVHPSALARLDQFEDDCYRRETVSIECADGQRRRASAYIVRESHRHVLTAEPWQPDEFVARGGLQQFVDRYTGFSRLAED